MPRRSLKSLQAKEEKAQQQMWALLYMTPGNLTDEDLRWAEEELARLESMTDEDLEEYYRSPAGQAEIAYERKLEKEEAGPIEQRPNALGRKLIRAGKLEFYQAIHSRVLKGLPRKKIAEELGVSIHRVKMALRALRRLTGQNYEHHRHGNNPEEFNRCPQCRGYFNRGTKKLHGEKLDGTPERRRKHKQKEIPESRLDVELGETDDEHDSIDQAYMKDQSKEGFPRPCAVCG